VCLLRTRFAAIKGGCCGGIAICDQIHKPRIKLALSNFQDSNWFFISRVAGNSDSPRVPACGLRAGFIETFQVRQTVLFSLLMVILVAWVLPHLSAADEGGGNARVAAQNPQQLEPCQMPAIFDVPAEQPAAPKAVSPYKRIEGVEGYWRLAESHDGVWWFLSPGGQTEFLNSVTTVQPFQTGRDKDGPAFLSLDYDGGISNNGNLDLWTSKTLARVRDAGFKGLGAWSHPAFHKTDIPMTRDLNIWSWLHGHRLYSPEFASAAEEAIKMQVAPLKENKSLVGYFLDNEIDWGDANCGPWIYFDELHASDPSRAEVMRIIQSVWVSPEKFNHDWNAKLRDWKDLDSWRELPRQNSQAYARLFSAWLSHLAEDYFRLTTSLVHKYDQNHLILGVRFKGYALPEVVRASKNFTQAQSINYYPADARLDAEMFRMMHELSGQPIMLSEYSFHALDGRSGNRNTVGFVGQVLDQQARADGYHLMTTRLARVPWIVGADWFQWNDEPPSGRSNDGEDANFGVVDIDDKPYDTLLDSVRRTAPQLNGLHLASSKDDGREIWRESFANKPVARVPYLTKAIRLNGELSDWPAEAKVEGIRHSQTVGLERSKLPLPNVYLGWREEGLYLGVEVFDNDIVGAPAQGWWWTRDNFEFWVSTKPVASDQNAYDASCHEFFFVPNSFPGDDGLAGTVGQLHRDGDALKDNLIPHPTIKQVCRIHPDRYVVEMFLPAKALNGFNPKQQPALAFNIHFRNFQHALDYFWSAPKDILTQFRPNTWGPVYLELPHGARGTETVQAVKLLPAATQPSASTN